MYNSLLSLNEEDIFENVYFMVVNINNGNKEVVNMKIIFCCFFLIQCFLYSQDV